MELSEPAIVTPNDELIAAQGNAGAAVDPFFTNVKSELYDKGFLVATAFATISSGLYRFLGIAVLLDVRDIPQAGPLHRGRISEEIMPLAATQFAYGRLARVHGYKGKLVSVRGVIRRAVTFRRSFDEHFVRSHFRSCFGRRRAVFGNCF